MSLVFLKKLTGFFLVFLNNFRWFFLFVGFSGKTKKICCKAWFFKKTNKQPFGFSKKNILWRAQYLTKSISWFFINVQLLQNQLVL